MRARRRGRLGARRQRRGERPAGRGGNPRVCARAGAAGDEGRVPGRAASRPGARARESTRRGRPADCRSDDEGRSDDEECRMSAAESRTVLVTGGGRGIGRAIALRFADAGSRVFVNFFVNREAAEKTARDIELRGGSAHLVQADVKEPAEIKRLIAEVGRVAGRLDVLVSNAASGVLKEGLELSAKQWDWVLSTNARPLLLLSQEAARLMTAGGRIIALSSLGSQRVIPGYAAVGVSKAALEALTRYLAVEFGRS